MQRDKDGKEKSYVPPRYEHEYNFWIIIHVNQPYFDEIRFRLNSSSIIIRPDRTRLMIQGGAKLGRTSADYQEHEALAEEIKTVLTGMRETVRENIAAANAPKMAQVCPFCGVTTTPDAQGRCE